MIHAIINIILININTKWFDLTSTLILNSSSSNESSSLSDTYFPDFIRFSGFANGYG